MKIRPHDIAVIGFMLIMTLIAGNEIVHRILEDDTPQIHVQGKDGHERERQPSAHHTSYEPNAEQLRQRPGEGLEERGLRARGASPAA